MLLVRSPASCCQTSLRPSRQNIQPFTVSSRRSASVVKRQRCITYAKQDQNEGKLQIPAILKIANGVTNSAANMLPATVPRPVAKLSVIGISSIIALWLFGKVVSTVFTIAAVGGAIYLLVKSQGSKGAASQDAGDLDEAIDPLASARRIMDKYK